jgi:hypothetical protein
MILQTSSRAPDSELFKREYQSAFSLTIYLLLALPSSSGSTTTTGPAALALPLPTPLSLSHFSHPLFLFLLYCHNRFLPFRCSISAFKCLT